MTFLKKVWKAERQGPTYTFYDGPPTANGKATYRTCFNTCY